MKNKKAYEIEAFLKWVLWIIFIIGGIYGLNYLFKAARTTLG